MGRLQEYIDAKHKARDAYARSQFFYNQILTYVGSCNDFTGGDICVTVRDAAMPGQQTDMVTAEHCKYFNAYQCCENLTCPMRGNNAAYVSAYKNYREANEKRWIAFKNLFRIRRK